MSFFDVDFGYLSKITLPPDKRQPVTLSWFTALLSPLQYLHDLVFNSYKTGATAAAYSAGTYAKGAMVLYKKAVYESLIDSNVSLPTTTSWRKVQDNFIGADERSIYNSQKIIYEYALNKWFGTTFRQLPSVSDIYITNNAPAIPVFRVGQIETRSSSVGTDGSSEFVGTLDFAASNFVNFTINCPVAVYNALDTVSANRDKIFRAFADNYCLAGLKYQIQTY